MPFLSKVAVFLFIAALSTKNIRAQDWDVVRKLTASDAAASDQFGFSVSISGEIVVVGADYDDDAGGESGSAYIYQRDAGGPENWGQVKKLTASDAAAGDVFGYSLSISGDTVIVGAFSDDDAGDRSGSAYVFQRDAGGADNWGEIKKLTASDAAALDLFGLSVAVNGDTAIVGAPLMVDPSGSAYVFQRNAGGPDNWGQVKKLTPSTAAQSFGAAVSTSGDLILVGARHGESTRGSAYIFARNNGGTDNWGEVKELIASDAAAFDQFGYSVSVSGDTAIVGELILRLTELDGTAVKSVDVIWPKGSGRAPWLPANMLAGSEQLTGPRDDDSGKTSA